MKKSMSKVLSLILAVVMVIGVVPFAMAADLPGTVTVTAAEGKTTLESGETVELTAAYDGTESPITWTWSGVTSTSDKATYTAPEVTEETTVTVTATASYTPAVTDEQPNPEAQTKTGSIVITVTPKEKPLGDPAITVSAESTTLVLKDGEATTQLKAEAAAGYTIGESHWTVAGATVEGSDVFTATKADRYAVSMTATLTANGKEFKDVKSNEIIIVVSDQTYTAQMSPASISMKMGETQQLTFEVLDNTTGKPVADLGKISWTSSNQSVAVVDDKGLVLAKGEGKATITATVELADKESSASCEISVDKGAYIQFENASTSTNSIVVAPSLKFDGAIITDPVFTFKVDGSDAKSGSSIEIARRKQGAVKVEIGVQSFKIDGVAATTEQVNAVASLTSYVSFYDVVNAVARTKKTAFMFDDKNVFYSVELNDREVRDPEGYSLKMLWYTEAEYSYVQLFQDAGTTDVASITYPGSFQNKFDPRGTKYSKMIVDGLKFTSLSKGVVELTYSLEEQGLPVQSGLIKIYTDNSTSDLQYSTTYNKSVRFNEKDFLKVWNKQNVKSDAYYVTFDAAPEYGTLYTGVDEKTKVNFTRDRFYFNAGRNDLSLSDVTYVPDSIFKTSYEVNIPFTIHGKYTDETYAGVLTIKMNGDMPFRDVNTGDWFYNDVQYVYTNDIMNGLSAYEFGPQNTLTRGMVVTMLHRMEGKPRAYKTGTFTDVASGTWYTEAVEWAAENNIVNGYGTTFGPNNNITRQDLAVILYRYAQYKKMSTYSTSSLTRFNDYQRVASYATNAMEWAVYNKIMNGNDRNMLSPTGNATRAEAAKMFHVFLELK